MSVLKANLDKLAASRSKAKIRRSGVIDTILEISRDRAQKAATPAANTLSGLSPVATAPASTPPVGGPTGQTGVTQTDRLGNKGGFDGSLDTPLQKLLKDFGGKVSVSSGYRSPERQAQLWSSALKKYGSAAAARKWVAPPGRSNHGRGLAADLKYSDAATRQLVHKRAGDYGLHFPLSNENWHIEPISVRKKR